MWDGVEQQRFWNNCKLEGIIDFSGMTEEVESVPVRSEETGMFKGRCFFNK